MSQLTVCVQLTCRFHILILWPPCCSFHRYDVAQSLIQRHSYLSDARGVAHWNGGLGELASCRGRGMTGALLQLVPEFGHLRAEQRVGWAGVTSSSWPPTLSEREGLASLRCSALPHDAERLWPLLLLRPRVSLAQELGVLEEPRRKKTVFSFITDSQRWFFFFN